MVAVPTAFPSGVIGNESPGGRKRQIERTDRKKENWRIQKEGMNRKTRKRRKREKRRKRVKRKRRR